MRIGPYEVLDEIARGGMGVVFRARHTDLNREVAIKLLGSRSLSESALLRFEREGRALGKLRHSGIVAVHATGDHDGKPYLVMDLVEGETLQNRLDRGPLSPASAAEVVAELASAVAYAHGSGVLHRDLKPSNVIFTRDGRPLLTDYGLARELDGDESRITQSGVMLGTPGYWPPEQARGDSDAVGTHSDVYGLGAILYAALTTQPPIVGESMIEVAVATADQRPTPPSQLVPAVDPQLEAICLKCLEKDPAGRFGAAIDLAKALQDYLRGEVGEGGAGGDPGRRSWVGVSLVAALALIGLLVSLAHVRSVRGDLRAAEAVSARLDARTWVARGLVRFHQEQHEAARACWTNALALDANCVEAHIGQGMTGYHFRDFVAAEAALSRGLALSPGHLQGLRYRGMTRFRLGRHEDSFADWTQLIKLAPRDADAWGSRGSVQFHLGNGDAALSDFDRSLELDPSDAEARISRAWVLASRGDGLKAVEDCDRALVQLPNNAQAYFHRAHAYQTLKRWKLARRDYDRAIQLAPKHAQALFGRAVLRMTRDKDWDGAKLDLDAALLSDPGNGMLYANRATVQAKRGRYEAALRDYERALATTSRKLDREFVRKNIREVKARMARRR